MGLQTWTSVGFSSAISIHHIYIYICKYLLWFQSYEGQLLVLNSLCICYLQIKIQQHTKPSIGTRGIRKLHTGMGIPISEGSHYCCSHVRIAGTFRDSDSHVGSSVERVGLYFLIELQDLQCQPRVLVRECF